MIRSINKRAPFAELSAKGARFFYSSVTIGVVGFAQEVVDADLIEAGKFDENGGGNVVFARFVFGIARLGHHQHFRHLRLIQVPIFPQIPNPRIHTDQPLSYPLLFYRKIIK